ncbi:MAG: DUF2935 domain-containing protein [Eubacteriales bacterium]|nr:DUF2935 domain-containing protein [Eubacteriales bacterium]
MKEYVALSLETHLFFARIMKEHSLFLLVGFPCREQRARVRADWFRREFEAALWQTVQLSNRRVRAAVLDSGEIVTEFTLKAERQTRALSGVFIDSALTEAERRLKAGCQDTQSREMIQSVRTLNRRVLRLLKGLIEFKEWILQEVRACRLYTTNYPLLIEHILREARLYHSIIMELEKEGCISKESMREKELFWNQIMMEHAQFIRGLLDPTECELIETADGFARDYCHLLEEARNQDMRSMDELTRKALRTTKGYQQFKTAGTEGITACRIRSVILPLLADHVLREANHYLRILESKEKGRD